MNAHYAKGLILFVKFCFNIKRLFELWDIMLDYITIFYYGIRIINCNIWFGDYPLFYLQFGCQGKTIRTSTALVGIYLVRKANIFSNFIAKRPISRRTQTKSKSHSFFKLCLIETYLCLNKSYHYHSRHNSKLQKSKSIKVVNHLKVVGNQILSLQLLKTVGTEFLMVLRAVSRLSNIH